MLIFGTAAAIGWIIVLALIMRTRDRRRVADGKSSTLSSSADFNTSGDTSWPFDGAGSHHGGSGDFGISGGADSASSDSGGGDSSGGGD